VAMLIFDPNYDIDKEIDVDAVLSFESFRALKLTLFESFRVLFEDFGALILSI
jgi:hypothetical protein